MFIGNIVSKNSINMGNLFNYCKDIESTDKNIPTLIIGWDFAVSIVTTKKISIIEKDIDENTSWTFTKHERRVEYEKDIDLFIKKCINLINANIKYENINILTINVNYIKKILKIISFNGISYIYVKNNSFAYILNDNTVYGLDLNSVDYLGIPRKKVYRILYGNGNKVFFDTDFLDKAIKNNISNNKIIPYLYANDLKK